MPYLARMCRLVPLIEYPAVTLVGPRCRGFSRLKSIYFLTVIPTCESYTGDGNGCPQYLGARTA